MKLGQEYAWVGWLHRDRKNHWTVTFKTPPATSRSAKLYVLTRSLSAGPVTYTEIGEVKPSLVKLSQAEGSTAFLEGRPVYEQSQ